MKATEIKMAEKLIRRYYKLNDLIMDYTDAFHDEIYHDINGYTETLYEIEEGYANGEDYTAEFENLKARVKSCEMLYKALVMFNDETETVFG